MKTILMKLGILMGLMVVCGSFFSCQKDEPYIPQHIGSAGCEEDMEYTQPGNVIISSPYTGRFSVGDTIHIKAYFTSEKKLVSSECYINSLSTGQYLTGLIPTGDLAFDYVVDNRVDSVVIEIGGILLNGYKDGSCGVQQLFRSAKIKVKLNL